MKNMYTVSQNTVACIIFYNLKKFKPIFIILAHYILTVLASNGIVSFSTSPQLRTLQIIRIVENDAFSRRPTVKFVSKR